MLEQDEVSRLLASVLANVQAIEKLLNGPPPPGKPAPTLRGSLRLVVDKERKAA
jgi:hypothetical protein